MIKVTDNRRKKNAVFFADIEHNRPFFFQDNPEQIYILLAYDENVYCLTHDFLGYDIDDFKDNSLCQYVNLEMIITDA